MSAFNITREKNQKRIIRNILVILISIFIAIAITIAIAARERLYVWMVFAKDIIVIIINNTVVGGVVVKGIWYDMIWSDLDTWVIPG